MQQILQYSAWLHATLMWSQILTSIQIPSSADSEWIQRTLLFQSNQMIDQSAFWESEYWIRRSRFFASALLLYDSLTPTTGQILLDIHPRSLITVSPSIHLSSSQQRIGGNVQLNLLTLSIPFLLYYDFQIVVPNSSSGFQLDHSLVFDLQGLSPLYLTGTGRIRWSRSDRNIMMTLARPVERSDIWLGFFLAAHTISDRYPLNRQWYRRERSRFYAAFQLDIGHAEPLYFTFAAALQQRSQRTSEQLWVALDNAAAFLIGLTSLHQNYESFEFLPDFTPVLPTGASGSVLFGYTTPLDSTAIPFVYLGGRAEQGAWIGNDSSLYLYGMVEGGSGFRRKVALYTYLGSCGNLRWRLSPSLEWQLWYSQQTRWNWNRFVQLSASEFHNLRGFSPFNLFGENRVLLNTQLLYYLFKWKSITIAGAAFADAAILWNQGQSFTNQPIFPTIGLGLHGFYQLFRLPHFVRLEVGYSLRSRQFFAQLSTYLPFRPSGDIQPPKIFFYGMDSDVEPIQ